MILRAQIECCIRRHLAFGKGCEFGLRVVTEKNCVMGQRHTVWCGGKGVHIRG